MPDDTLGTTDGDKTPGQKDFEARANAEAAVSDAAEAIANAKIADMEASEAIANAESAAQSAEMASMQPNKNSLIEAGLAILEAKDAIQIADAARGEAESARNKAENARVTAEHARNMAEEVRANAEESRTEAEKIRGSEESARLRSEENKRLAIEAKANAEIALQQSTLAIEEARQAQLHAEEAREKAVATARRLQEQQTELLEYATSLEIINKDLEQFALIASHDLQAPLRKIKSFSALILEDGNSTLSPQSLDNLQRLQKSTQSMQVLIGDLLALARISHRNQFGLINLETLVREVVSGLDAQIGEAQAVIKIGPLHSIRGDESQLKQLMQNLIENALKFRVAERTPVIEIASVCPDESVFQITVSDNGVGFDQSDAERIFETFVRLHGVSTFPGTGVGLAICKRIAQRHGGNIAVTSHPGEGSVFTVTLPVRQGNPVEG